MADINFQRAIQDFRHLSKDIGQWPLIPRLVVIGLVFIIIAALSWFLFCKPKLDELDLKRQEEARLKTEWLDKKKKAVGIDEYRAQLSGVDLAFGTLLQQLPGKTEMDALITDINQAGLGRGLKIDLFKPGAEKVEEFYATLPISLKLIGAYHDLGSFIGDIAKLSRIVTLSDIVIDVDKQSNSLAMTAQANTFRYLDEAEIDAGKKSKKAKPGGNS